MIYAFPSNTTGGVCTCHEAGYSPLGAVGDGKVATTGAGTAGAGTTGAGTAGAGTTGAGTAGAGTAARWLVGLLLAAAGCADAADSCSVPCPKSGGWARGVGISLAGGEFGVENNPVFSNRNPGKHGVDYHFNGPKTIGYFADRGIRLFRIPFRWERIQPSPGGPLDKMELTRLRDTVAWAEQHQSRIILDLHNYGRYRLRLDDGIEEVVVGQPDGEGTVRVSAEALADCWRRLARAFCGREAVVGYGIMNEPYSMGAPASRAWQGISRQVVDAIRKVDPYTYILVSGDEWAHADSFDTINGDTPWIDSSVRNIVYEAHCYFDNDGSGKYRNSFDEERALDPHFEDRATERVRAFVEWCEKGQARGFVGELGVPGDDPRWIALLRRCLEYLQQHRIGACYWAAGERWNDYPLSIQPRCGEPAARQLSVVGEFAGQFKPANSAGR